MQNDRRHLFVLLIVLCLVSISGDLAAADTPKSLLRPTTSSALSIGQDHNYASLNFIYGVNRLFDTFTAKFQKPEDRQYSLLSTLLDSDFSNSEPLKILLAAANAREDSNVGVLDVGAANSRMATFQALAVADQSGHSIAVFSPALAFSDDARGFDVNLQLFRDTASGSATSVGVGYDISGLSRRYDAQRRKLKCTNSDLVDLYNKIARTPGLSKLTDDQKALIRIKVLAKVRPAFTTLQDFIADTQDFHTMARVTYHTFGGGSFMWTEGLHLSKLMPFNRWKDAAGITTMLAVQAIQLYQPSRNQANGAVNQQTIRGSASVVWQDNVPFIKYRSDRANEHPHVYATMCRWSRRAGVEYTFRNTVDDGDTIDAHFTWRNVPLIFQDDYEHHQHDFVPEYTLFAGKARSSDIFGGVRIGGNF